MTMERSKLSVTDREVQEVHIFRAERIPALQEAGAYDKINKQ